MIDLETINETVDALEGLEDADHDLNVGLIRDQMIALIREVKDLRKVLSTETLQEALAESGFHEEAYWDKENENIRLRAELAKFHECNVNPWDDGRVCVSGHYHKEGE